MIALVRWAADRLLTALVGLLQLDDDPQDVPMEGDETDG